MPIDLPSVVAGAIAKKFVDAACDGGRAFLARYFGSAAPQTIVIAEERANDFLNRLAAKVQRLEEQQGYDHSVIEKAMVDPSFGTMLQRALIHSAETANETAHSVLANLVAEKIVSDCDTSKSSALQSAAVVASTLSTPHFAALALKAVERFGAPDFEAPPRDQPEYLAACRTRAETLRRR